MWAQVRRARPSLPPFPPRRRPKKLPFLSAPGLLLLLLSFLLPFASSSFPTPSGEWRRKTPLEEEEGGGGGEPERRRGAKNGLNRIARRVDGGNKGRPAPWVEVVFCAFSFLPFLPSCNVEHFLTCFHSQRREEGRHHLNVERRQQQ